MKPDMEKRAYYFAKDTTTRNMIAAQAEVLAGEIRRADNELASLRRKADQQLKHCFELRARRRAAVQAWKAVPS